MSIYKTGTGQNIAGVHAYNDDCAQKGCVIHNPSPHSMRDWPTNWREDRKLMERVCEHGVGHPDPDSIAYAQRHGGTADSVHGCDGCCSGAYDHLKDL